MTASADDLDRLRRDRRVVDQTISMQSSLRSLTTGVSVGFTILILAASVVSIAFAFTENDEPIRIVWIERSRTEWLGVLAIVTLVVSISDLLYDRRSAARSRQEAVTSLFVLKRDLTRVLNDPTVADPVELQQRYDAVMASVPPVPDHLFNRLKARHLRKRRVSKVLSEHPGLGYYAARRRVIRDSEDPD